MFAKIGSGSRLERPLRAPRSLLVALLIVMFTLSFGFVTPQVALAAGNLSQEAGDLTHDWDCNSAHLGIVCATASWSGYNAEYVNNSGQCFWADFNLMLADGRVFGDNGAFWSCPQQYNSYFFAVGAQGCA